MYPEAELTNQNKISISNNTVNSESNPHILSFKIITHEFDFTKYKKIIISTLFVFLIILLLTSVELNKITGLPIQPLRSDMYVLGENFTYKFMAPIVGDIVTFNPDGRYNNFIGVITDYSEETGLYEIYSKANKSWKVTKHQIENKIFFPFNLDTRDTVIEKFDMNAGLNQNTNQPTIDTNTVPSASPTPTIKSTQVKNTTKPPTRTPTFKINSPTTTPQSTPTNQPTTTGNFQIHTTLDNGNNCQYCTIYIYYPNDSTESWQADENGNKNFYNLQPGSYRLDASYATNRTSQNIQLSAGETKQVNLVVSSIINTPTPIPDTTPPTLSMVNGPFDWGDQGLCFTINGDQVTDNSSARPFAFSYNLDQSSWSDFQDNQATKCYNGLSSGNHSVNVRVRDPAGNISNSISVNFTK